jgi:hypothetical protein
MDNDFYITLPSNGASDVYPGNRPTCYRTDLNINKKLLSGWEVGLSQIQFTRNWYESTPEFKFLAWIGRFTSDRRFVQTYTAGYAIGNLEKTLLDITAAGVTSAQTTGDGIITPCYTIARLVTVPAFNQWSHVDQFGAEVAKCIQEAFSGESALSLRVKYERTAAGTTAFHVTEHSAANSSEPWLGMSSVDTEMFEILGIPSRIESSKLKTRALKVYMFNQSSIPRSNGFPSLETIFVYTDVCEEQVIGSQRGQLLKLVPVTAKKGERQCNEYPRPSYVPVVPTSLRNIEVSLNDLTGKEVQIWDENSIVTIVLHFRRRKGYAAEGGWC